MTKTRVRKPFMREDAQAHPGLTTEPEEFPAIELPGEEKRSTKVKNAAAAKMPEKVKHPSNLMVRTATGAVYILLTVVCIWASEVSTAIYLSVLSAICAGEFYYMLRSDAKLPNEFLGICAAALFPLATWVSGISGVVVVFAIFVLTLLVWYRTNQRCCSKPIRRGVHRCHHVVRHVATRIASRILGCGFGLGLVCQRLGQRCLCLFGRVGNR